MIGAFQTAFQLFLWGVLCLAFDRWGADREWRVLSTVGGGFATGAVVVFVSTLTFGGSATDAGVRAGAGLAFLFSGAVSVAALRPGGEGGGREAGRRRTAGRLLPAGGVFAASAVAGGIVASGLVRNGVTPAAWGELLLVVLTGVGILRLALVGEVHLPKVLAVTGNTLPVLAAALLLAMASAEIRLDLFAPLTMKVMKFLHDFVHQFFESMLIPDHLFFRRDAWDYIGLLFSNEVGFWGGLAIWFAPALLCVAATSRERLPSVAHVRQGAKRRTLLAGHLRARRGRLAVSWLAVVVLAVAVYQSRFPTVEYWNPEPVAVTAGPDGMIFIPFKKGEVDLNDGRLHKFLLTEGGTKVRFFVVRKPGGGYAVTLDACSICKPVGYGQAGDRVVCLYCRTLIPIETVGSTGGCNPVPVGFSAGGDGVRVSALQLATVWNETVQAVHRVPGRGR